MSANPSVPITRTPQRPLCTGRSWRRRGLPGVIVLLAALSGVGCAKHSTGPAAPPLNSDQANANGRITAQHVFGTSGQRSVIWDLKPAPGGSPWFVGELDGHDVVGRLDAGGAPTSHVELPYVYDLTVLASTSPLPGGAIAVGSEGPDKEAYAWLMTPAGTIQHVAVLASDSSSVWFDGVAPLSDSLFVAVGGEITQGRTNPLVALIALSADTLEIRQPVALMALPATYAYCVATDPADAGAAIRRVYISTERSTANGAAAVHGVDITPGSPGPYSVAWSTPLVGKSAGTSVLDLNVFDGAVYAAGVANDPDKGGPVNGNYWTSGLAVRLSLAGAIAWTIVVPTSKHSDGLLWVQPAADVVTTAGYACDYLDNGHLFGYGWIQRFANPIGHVTSSLTFGDAGCESYFGGGYLDGATLDMGGYTGLHAYPGPSQAWWCALNLSGTLPASAARVSEPVRAGETPPPLRGRMSSARWARSED